MSLRKILVPLVGASRDTGALQTAGVIAKSLTAHLDGLFVRPDPSETLPFMGEGVAGPVIQDLVNAATEAANHAAERARASLATASSENGLTLTEAPQGPGTPSAGFSADTGPFARIVANHAILSDLVVFENSRDEDDDGYGIADALQEVLMSVRRPILLAPKSPSASVGSRVTIGWDGSAEAALAVREAMPFLRQSAQVQILNVKSGRKDTTLTDRMADYLAYNGVACMEHVVDPKGRPAGQALMEEALKSGSDLLVVGGYSHSRIGEMFFGGATRHLLSNAELPILMAH